MRAVGGGAQSVVARVETGASTKVCGIGDGGCVNRDERVIRGGLHTGIVSWIRAAAPRVPVARARARAATPAAASHPVSPRVSSPCACVIVVSRCQC